MSSVTEIVDEQLLVDGVHDMALQEQGKKTIQEEIHEPSFGNHGGCCAICLNEIPLQETAMVKGCEHTYCVTCILRWASCKESPTCPQCKHPFDFLNVHRALDGSIEDYLFEESVCLLLRASWFIPLGMMEQAPDSYGYHDDFDIPCDYEDEDDDLDEFHLYMHGSSLRIGNRRWGDNGFVRSGRQEARPVQKYTGSGSSSSSSSSSGSSSCEPKDRQVKTTNTTGRRAKRAMKREAANRAAEVASAAKHEAHLVRLGRK